MNRRLAGTAVTAAIIAAFLWLATVSGRPIFLVHAVVVLAAAVVATVYVSRRHR